MATRPLPTMGRWRDWHQGDDAVVPASCRHATRGYNYGRTGRSRLLRQRMRQVVATTRGLLELTDMDDVEAREVKAREVQARHAAERRHLWLRKSVVGRDAPWFVLVSMASSRIVDGPLRLEQVESWLNDNQQACA